jgi:WD40 repeat protein
VPAARFPIEYSDGMPHNVETLLVNPVTGEKFLVTKAKKSPGALFALPQRLQPDATNVATLVAVGAPRKVSDGAISPDGDSVVLRNASKLYVYDTTSHALVQTVDSPPLRKGESVAFNPSGRSILVGSEGKKSPLIWVGFDSAAGRVVTR